MRNKILTILIGLVVALIIWEVYSVQIVLNEIQSEIKFNKELRVVAKKMCGIGDGGERL